MKVEKYQYGKTKWLRFTRNDGKYVMFPYNTGLNFSKNNSPRLFQIALGNTNMQGDASIFAVLHLANQLYKIEYWYNDDKKIFGSFDWKLIDYAKKS